MDQGKVKWFSKEKGYGFITSLSGEDHYFNVQAINGVELPSIGDGVTFESKPGNKGKRAANVSITSKNAQFVQKNTDDRIKCPSCNKKIVPRMITYQGKAERSICPYCAAEVKNFKSSSCFIATAVYGDSDCWQVKELRAFRDKTLMKSYLGNKFVSFYYLVSPSISNWLKTKKRLSTLVRKALDFLVNKI